MRSSSTASVRRRSPARSAWAARTAKVPAGRAAGRSGAAVGEQQLQRAERRLAERERHDRAAVLEATRPRASPARCARGERRRARPPVGSAEPESAASPGPAARSAREQAMGAVASAASVATWSAARVSSEPAASASPARPSRSAQRRAAAASVAEGPPGERDLVGRRERERALPLVELAPAAKQLERAETRCPRARESAGRPPRRAARPPEQRRRQPRARRAARPGPRAPGPANPRARRESRRLGEHRARAGARPSRPRAARRPRPRRSPRRCAPRSRPAPRRGPRARAFPVSRPWSDRIESTGLLNSARGPAGATARRGGAARPDRDPAHYRRQRISAGPASRAREKTLAPAALLARAVAVLCASSAWRS